MTGPLPSRHVLYALTLPSDAHIVLQNVYLSQIGQAQLTDQAVANRTTLEGKESLNAR